MTSVPCGLDFYIEMNKDTIKLLKINFIIVYHSWFNGSREVEVKHTIQDQEYFKEFMLEALNSEKNFPISEKRDFINSCFKEILRYILQLFIDYPLSLIVEKGNPTRLRITLDQKSFAVLIKEYKKRKRVIPLKEIYFFEGKNGAFRTLEKDNSKN